MRGALLHALENVPWAKKAFDRALLVFDTPDLGKILQQILIVGNLIVRPLFAFIDTAVSPSQRAFTASWMGLREGTNMLLAETIFPPVQKGAFWLAKQLFKPEELANFKAFETLAKNNKAYQGLHFEHASIDTIKKFNGLAKVHLNDLSGQVEKSLYAQAKGGSPLTPETLEGRLNDLLVSAFQTRKTQIAGKKEELWAFFPHFNSPEALANAALHQEVNFVPAVVGQVQAQLAPFLSKAQQQALHTELTKHLETLSKQNLATVLQKANEALQTGQIAGVQNLPATARKTITAPDDLAQLGAQIVEDGLLKHGQIQFTPTLEGLFSTANIAASLTALGVISPQLSNVMVTPFLKLVKKITGKTTAPAPTVPASVEAKLILSEMPTVENAPSTSRLQLNSPSPTFASLGNTEKLPTLRVGPSTSPFKPSATSGLSI